VNVRFADLNSQSALRSAGFGGEKDGGREESGLNLVEDPRIRSPQPRNAERTLEAITSGKHNKDGAWGQSERMRSIINVRSGACGCC
jgi:hypothetical protein